MKVFIYLFLFISQIFATDTFNNSSIRFIIDNGSNQNFYQCSSGCNNSCQKLTDSSKTTNRYNDLEISYSQRESTYLCYVDVQGNIKTYEPVVMALSNKHIKNIPNMLNKQLLLYKDLSKITGKDPTSLQHYLSSGNLQNMSPNNRKHFLEMISKFDKNNFFYAMGNDEIIFWNNNKNDIDKFVKDDLLSVVVDTVDRNMYLKKWSTIKDIINSTLEIAQLNTYFLYKYENVNGNLSSGKTSLRLTDGGVLVDRNSMCVSDCASCIGGGYVPSNISRAGILKYLRYRQVNTSDCTGSCLYTQIEGIANICKTIGKSVATLNNINQGGGIGTYYGAFQECFITNCGTTDVWKQYAGGNTASGGTSYLGTAQSKGFNYNFNTLFQNGSDVSQCLYFNLLKLSESFKAEASFMNKALIDAMNTYLSSFSLPIFNTFSDVVIDTHKDLITRELSGFIDGNLINNNLTCGSNSNLSSIIKSYNSYKIIKVGSSFKGSVLQSRFHALEIGGKYASDVISENTSEETHQDGGSEVSDTSDSSGETQVYNTSTPTGNNTYNNDKSITEPCADGEILGFYIPIQLNMSGEIGKVFNSTNVNSVINSQLKQSTFFNINNGIQLVCMKQNTTNKSLTFTKFLGYYPNKLINTTLEDVKELYSSCISNIFREASLINNDNNTSVGDKASYATESCNTLSKTILEATFGENLSTLKADWDSKYGENQFTKTQAIVNMYATFYSNDVLESKYKNGSGTANLPLDGINRINASDISWSGYRLFKAFKQSVKNTDTNTTSDKCFLAPIDLDESKDIFSDKNASAPKGFKTNIQIATDVESGKKVCTNIMNIFNTNAISLASVLYSDNNSWESYNVSDNSLCSQPFSSGENITYSNNTLSVVNPTIYLGSSKFLDSKSLKSDLYSYITLNTSLINENWTLFADENVEENKNIETFYTQYVKTYLNAYISDVKKVLNDTTISLNSYDVKAWQYSPIMYDKNSNYLSLNNLVYLDFSNISNDSYWNLPNASVNINNVLYSQDISCTTDFLKTPNNCINCTWNNTLNGYMINTGTYESVVVKY